MKRRLLSILILTLFCSSMATAQKRLPPPGEPGYVRLKDSKRVNVKDIMQMVILVGNGAAPATLTPGAPVPFRVVITDKKGKQFATSYPGSAGYDEPGNLDSEYLRVTTSLMTIDWALNRLTPDRHPSRTRGDVYRVHAEYGPPDKPHVIHDVSFVPDFAFVDGPDPADVQRLVLKIGDAADGAQLIPGAAYPIEAIATDKAGRTYRSGAPADGREATLPFERLAITTDHVSFDPSAREIRMGTDVTSAAQRYQLTAAYKGRADITVTRTFAPDIVRLLGPEPADVTDLQVDVQGVSSSSAIPPGSTLSFVIRAKDKTGRTFSTDSSDMRLPASRLKVAVSNLTIDLASRRIVSSPDAKAMVGKSYSMSVMYVGRPDLERIAKFKPDFAALLNSYMLTTDRLDTVGNKGESGGAGLDGNPGRIGTTAASNYGSGTDGGSGTSGRTGQPGRRGERGARVRVSITDAFAIDGVTRVMVGEIIAGDKAPEYFVRRLDAKPVTFVSQGGPGGAGGLGGRGGAGGAGGEGWVGGDGGQGGEGGMGGRGGEGGPGGDVTITVSSEELAQLVLGESVGGVGGRGGSGGAPGAAGPGGKNAKIRGVAAISEAISNGLTGKTSSVPPGGPGRPGEAGMRGDEGDAGTEGLSGQADTRVGELGTLKSRLPQALASLLIFK